MSSRLLRRVPRDRAGQGGTEALPYAWKAAISGLTPRMFSTRVRL